MAFAGSSDRARDARTPTAGPHDDATARDARDPRDTNARDTTARERSRAERSPREAADAGPRRPRGRPFSRSLELEADWPGAGTVGTFGAGVAVGALLGAGLALLLAPDSGPMTRRRLGRVSKRARGRAVDAWAELGEELRHATFRTRRTLRRRMNEKLGRDDSLLGSLRRRREHRADDAPIERTRRRKPWSRGERDTVAVEL